MLKLLFGREPPRGTASGTVTRPANLLPDIAVTPASAADVTPGTERARRSHSPENSLARSRE